MISESELLRQTPKVGVDLFFWKDDNDDIYTNVMTEEDVQKDLSQIYFCLLIDTYGDMRDMSVNKGVADICLVGQTETISSKFKSDALDLDGCKVKELEQQLGWKVEPTLTYSFHIYSDDAWVADQLKYKIRRRFGVVCSKAPYTAELVLSKHAETIDNHLRQFLKRIPEIREDYFNNPPPPPPEKLDNPRSQPPKQERLRCYLCGLVFLKHTQTLSNHLKTNHYSGIGSQQCDLCSCSFVTPASLHTHRIMVHPRAALRNRTKFGITDISEEDAGKCDAYLESVKQEGSKRKKFKCIWKIKNKTECGILTIGLRNSRDHVCTHLQLKPYTCPEPECDYSSSFFNATVLHYQNRHEREEEEDKDSGEENDGPPEKKMKSPVFDL
ncbi:uncharacterized protein LOC110841676 isoform X2 [Folsomia candida]|uniref:Zinc finger protein 76 n=1 Tax=Folsomia candida TaxID=158441 RepID=A0A226F478_FOLCA|nr:uncharacterized protein LOC110841676 isoform X2 [Folsomia candida]OXA64595.1 Zinc finger protein 76 [Folsomia candida]